MVRKIISDEEIKIPKKVVKAKKKRIEVVEETVKCPICKNDVVFKITNQYTDGVLKKTERKQETWSHDPLKCLQNASVDFNTQSEVEKCSNCKNWAGNYNSCGDRRDEYCNKHSRLMTEKEYEWIKKFYPDKVKTWNGKEVTFEDMQRYYNKLKYICYADEWCEHYEDDR